MASLNILFLARCRLRFARRQRGRDCKHRGGQDHRPDRALFAETKRPDGPEFFRTRVLTPCRSGCRSFFTEKRIFLFLLRSTVRASLFSGGSSARRGVAVVDAVDPQNVVRTATRA